MRCEYIVQDDRGCILTISNKIERFGSYSEAPRLGPIYPMSHPMNPVHPMLTPTPPPPSMFSISYLHGTIALD